MAYIGNAPYQGSVASINIVDGTIDTPDLKDGSVTSAKLETVAGLTSGSYGTASAVPQITVDAKGRITSVSSVNISSLGDTVISSSGTSAALRITQTGSGNALLVEDSANPDASPFVIDASGNVTVGKSTPESNFGLLQVHGTGPFIFGTASYQSNVNATVCYIAKSRGATVGDFTIVQSGDDLGSIRFLGADGTNFIRAAQITVAVDGTPGTNDMPGRLVFSTTADGASSPTERMRIDSAGNVGIGGAASAGQSFRVRNNITGSVNSSGIVSQATIQSDVTSSGLMFSSYPSTADAAFTLSNLIHYDADQGTITGGSRTAPTSQYGFRAASSLTGATNNYGFYSNIASGTGRWNFYANGTAANYFAGTTLIGTTTNTNSSTLVVNGTISQTVSGTQYLVVDQSDIGTGANEIPLNQYLGANAYVDTEKPALNVGTGITTGTGTICKANGGIQGGVFEVTIIVDLTGLNSGGTAGDIIGVNGTALPCYIAQLPAMTVLGGRMTCLETPAGGDTDIDLYSATEGTGVEDQAITALTETQIINAGTQSIGTVTYFAADPATNAYFYLVGQGTANATYTAGRFLIEIFGVQ